MKLHFVLGNNLSNPISTAGITFILVMFACSAIGPSIYFMGDPSEQTNEIDIYYDVKDVKQEYRTIGSLTHDKFVDYDINLLKELMIRKAKENGGDGIIFMDVIVTRENAEDGDRPTVTARVIKYLN